MHRHTVIVALLAGILLVGGTAPAIATVQSGANNSTTTTVTTTVTPTATATPTPTPTPTPTTATTTAPASTQEWSPPGEFSLTELRRDGTHPSNAPPGVRLFPDGSGAVALQRDPVDLFDQSQRKFLGSGTLVRSNQLILYSTRFGESLQPTTFTVHLVYWHPATKQVTRDGSTTTVEYAAGQHSETAKVTLSPGYDRQTVALKPHYDDEWQVTAWLSKDGQRVPGAQWRFRHQSIPTTSGVDIDSLGDFLRAVGWFVIVPFGILAPFEWWLAKKAREAAEDVPPGKSAVFWAGLLFVIVVAVAAGIYVEAAHLLYRFPWALGIAITIPLFPLFLAAGGTNVEKVLLVQEILDDVDEYRGPEEPEEELEGIDVDPADENFEAGRRYVRLGVVHKARRDGREVLVRPNSLKAFLGRWIGELDAIPVSDVKCRTKNVGDAPWASGGFDEIWELDPQADPPDAFMYSPPTLKRSAPLWPEWDIELVEETEGRFHSIVAGMAPLGRAFQKLWPFALAGGVVWVSYRFGAEIVDAPTILAGLMLGALVLVSLRGSSARASMQSSPMMYQTPHAIIAVKAKLLSEARTLEQAKTALRKEQAKSEKTVLDELADRDTTFTGELLDDMTPDMDPERVSEQEDAVEGPTDE